MVTTSVEVVERFWGKLTWLVQVERTKVFGITILKREWLIEKGR